MESNRLVSVIIPVHNCEQYLAEAIESVLAQTYRPIELIVVDDGSADGSAEVAGRYHSEVRYCRQAHSGAGAARNRGVNLAQGSFIAFLDADDLWAANKLERQMTALDEDPGLDMVFAHVEQFYSPDLPHTERRSIRESVRRLPGHVPSAILIRRDALLHVGPFGTGWRVGEFADWYLRAMDQGLNARVLPDVMVRRRLHTGNLGLRHRDSRTGYLGVLKASLDRRRKGDRLGVDSSGEPLE